MPQRFSSLLIFCPFMHLSWIAAITSTLWHLSHSKYSLLTSPLVIEPISLLFFRTMQGVSVLAILRSSSFLYSSTHSALVSPLPLFWNCFLQVISMSTLPDSVTLCCPHFYQPISRNWHGWPLSSKSSLCFLWPSSPDFPSISLTTSFIPFFPPLLACSQARNASLGPSL